MEHGAVRSRRSDLLVTSAASGALVLDRSNARAHLLNATAAWLWDLLDGERTAVDIAGVVAAELGIEPAVVLDDIVRALDDLAAAELLDGGAASTVSAPEPPLLIEAVATDLGPDLGGPFEAIGMPFGVSTASPVLEQATSGLLVQLRAGEPAPSRGIAYTMLDHGGDEAVGGRFEVRVGAERLARAGDPGAAVDHLLVDVNRRAIDVAEGRLLFHAAAVEVGGRVVMMPAASGSGKSTLAAALVSCGARYGSDEAAVIDPVSLLVEPYCKPLSLSAVSLAALARITGGFPLDPQSFDGSGSKHHVDPASIGRSMTGPAPLAAIVFPRYLDDGPTSIEPMRVEDALTALVPCTFAATWAVDGALERVVAMVESMPSYQLVVGDLDEAVRSVCAVAAGEVDRG